MKNRRAIFFSLALSLVFALLLAMLSLFSSSSVTAMPGETLSSLNPDLISSVAIDRTSKNGNPIRISLAHVDGRWRMEEPMKVEADLETVRRIIDSVVFAEPQDALSPRDMNMLGEGINCWNCFFISDCIF